MTGIDMNAPAERSGRLLMASWWGAWLAAAGLETIGEGDRWGLVFLTIGLILAAVTVAMLRTEACRDEPGWGRRDTSITIIVAVGAVGTLVHGLFMTESSAERNLVLVAAPVWVVLAVAFVALRRRAIRRGREAGRRQNVPRES